MASFASPPFTRDADRLSDTCNGRVDLLFARHPPLSSNLLLPRTWPSVFSFRPTASPIASSGAGAALMGRLSTAGW